MKKYNNLILALLVCLVCQPTAAQAFRGQIVYTLREKDSTHPFCTYSFNDYFVKKTDTASGSLFVTAGFTEIIWDIREKMQYLINHGTGVIYFSKYQDEGNHKNLPLSESKIISGRECLRYEVTDSVPLTMNDLPDTLLSDGRLWMAQITAGHAAEQGRLVAGAFRHTGRFATVRGGESASAGWFVVGERVAGRITGGRELVASVQAKCGAASART